MDPAAKIKYWARMEFHVVVVKDAELENRNLMIEEGSRELDLGATWVRCRSIEFVRSTQREKARIVARVDGLRVLPAALADALDEIESLNVRLGVLNIRDVGGAGCQLRVENLVEVSRHQFETGLSRVERFGVGVVIAHHHRFGSYLAQGCSREQ